MHTREQKEKHSIYYAAVMTDILIGSQAYGDCSMFRLNFHMYDTAITTSFFYIWELVYSIQLLLIWSSAVFAMNMNLDRETVAG